MDFFLQVMNIGIAYMSLDSIDLALSFQNKTCKISKGKFDKPYAEGLTNIGKINLIKKEYDNPRIQSHIKQGYGQGVSNVWHVGYTSIKKV